MSHSFMHLISLFCRLRKTIIDFYFVRQMFAQEIENICSNLCGVIKNLNQIVISVFSPIRPERQKV